jgi:hypothetical protein
MVDIVQVDSALADGVESEVYSARPMWSYFPETTDFHSERASPEQKLSIEKHAQNYGPMSDTQRISSVIYQFGYGQSVLFANIRNNPNSAYRKLFYHIPNLIDHLQSKYIPSNYIVERFMVNMQMIRPQWSLNNIHPDIREGQVVDPITILYYVNDSDGDTYFFDNDTCIKRVQPVKGTAAIYPSTTMHAGSTPVRTQTRSVINMVFIPKPSNVG